jgi:proteasome alpha subunit
VGAGRDTAMGILKEEYRDSISLEDAIKLAVKCLAKALEARGLQPRIKIAVIPAATRKMEMLRDDVVEKYIKGLSLSK